MTALSRERLLSALPRTAPYTLVGEHTLKGETVVLRALSGEHYTQWLTTTDPVESRIVLLVGGLAEPALTAADAEQIAGLEAALVVELTNAIAAFAGLIPSTVESSEVAPGPGGEFRDAE